MKLLLVRHSEQREREENPGLTERGQELVRSQAALCKNNHVTVEQIRHSNKKRAAETAQILSEYLEPEQGLVEMEGLQPYDPIEPVAELLQQEQVDLMYVGHLPFLFELVDLLTAKTGSGMHKFGHANIVCLSRTDDTWTVNWTLPAELAECWRAD